MNELDQVRADLWLWTARFFKTRRLAREALDGGKVALNGALCKPAKLVRCGDELQVTKGRERFEVQVLGLADKRGPARVAQTLYAEHDASRQRREEQRAQARLSRPVRPEGRPDKADRRKLRRLKREP